MEQANHYGKSKEESGWPYDHAEAFMLMWYRCPRNHTFRMWNSRDGVTPFLIGCLKCDTAGTFDDLAQHSLLALDVPCTDHLLAFQRHRAGEIDGVFVGGPSDPDVMIASEFFGTDPAPRPLAIPIQEHEERGPQRPPPGASRQVIRQYERALDKFNRRLTR